MKYQQPIINSAADATRRDRPYHRVPLTYRLAFPELLITGKTAQISAAQRAESGVITLSFFALLAAAVGAIAWGLIAGGHC